MKVFLMSLLKKLFNVIAVVIIVAAFLVSVTRLLTPILDKHRADFEKWASDSLQMPVTIGQVEASWFQYQPEITLNQTTILKPDTQQPIIQMQKVRVFFSIPRSLWQRKFALSGVMISDTNINLKQTAKGEFLLQGFPTFKDKPFKSETKFEEIMAWLSLQPRLILRDINIHFTKFSGQKRFVTIYNLSFENRDAKHTVLGKGVLHQNFPTEVSLAVKWRGNKVDLSDMSARAYLQLSGVSLSQWFKGYKWQNWQVNQGIGSAKIWGTWKKGSFLKLQSIFQIYGLNLYSNTDKSARIINRINGQLGWKRDTNGYVMAGEDLIIDLPNRLWPVTNFYIALVKDVNGMLTPRNANFGYVNLNDVQSFLNSSPPLLSDPTRKLLATLQLQGEVKNAAIAISDRGMTDWQHLYASANFNHISFKPWRNFPGINNLSGRVNWNGTQGHLVLQSNNTIFQYEPFFTKSFDVDQLSGDITAQVDQNNNWMFKTPLMQMQNSDVRANVSGNISFPNNASPVTDLKTQFSIQNVKQITRYLPTRIMNSDLVQWLQQSLLSGEIVSAQGIVQGNLNDFPFENGKGKFELTGLVKDINLHYAIDWPTLQHINGKLSFSGRRFTVNADEASTLGIPITHIQAVIPYLGGTEPEILQMQSDEIKTDFIPALSFIHQSPLEETIGKMFAGMHLEGPITLALKMTIPFKSDAKTRVNGELSMQDAQMNFLSPVQFQVKNLNGKLHFTEDTIAANNLQGNLLNKPLKIALKTLEKDKDNSVVQTTLNYTLDVADLENMFKIPFTKFAQGRADVTTLVNFSQHDPIEMELHSNLAGITLDLPKPYAKKLAERQDFSANIILQEPIKMKLNYGHLLNAALILEHKDKSFNLFGVDLRLGEADAAWPSESGLNISGNLEELNWDELKKYVHHSNASQFSYPVNKLDIYAKKLKIGDELFHEMRLQATPNDRNWNINITSPEITGQIQAPLNFKNKDLITAQFQRLNLHSLSIPKEEDAALKLNSLPSIYVVANDVSFNEIPIGQVVFKTAPSQNGLTIQLLRIMSPRIDLQAIGDWTQNDDHYTTHLRGKMTSKNVSELLSSLNFDAHNFIASKGQVHFNLSWNEAPFVPTPASMNGRMNIKLGIGRIVEIGQASGAKMDLSRMLNIFSLQSIPRRFNFDFSDLYQKGYSFDSLTGDFTLQNGNAYTNNSHLIGNVANVSVIGRIGLKDKDYDLTLKVDPHITSSIPIAATIITGNPLIGVAAWAVNKVTSPIIAKATDDTYVIKGSWDPTWETINLAKKQ